MSIDYNGNVGIGTTSPNDILHVSKAGAATRLRVGNNGAHDASIYFNTSTDWSIGTDTSNSNSLTFGNSSAIGTSTKMVIKTNGNIGIGTTNPQQKLHVQGNIYLGPNNTNNFIHSGAHLGLQADGEVKIVSDVNDTGGVGASDIIFGYGSSTNTDANKDFTEAEMSTYPRVEVMRIDVSTNRVGIGTNSPGYTLEVTAGNGIFVGDGGAAVLAADSNTGIFSIGDTDELGDGVYITNTGTSKIDVFSGGSVVFRVDVNGNVHADGDVVAYSTTVSDKRLKDNIFTIGDPLGKIKALRGVEYDWNNGSRKGQHDLGLIAQEVEEVLPMLVREHEMPFLDGAEDGTVYKTVDYEKMVALLVEGMKEQQETIDKLEDRIKKLENR
jgi:hypothetical protein